MQLAAYRDVLAVREARAAMLLGLLIRVPMFAATVVLTIHIVSTLGESYGAAGVATTVATVALAISGPWRGRRLDRVGLRRTMAPSIVAQALCWSVAPFVSYGPLLVLAGLAALLAVPIFTIVRQVVIAHVPEHQRRSALSLDSASTELSFMIGPLLGVWAATAYSTAWTIFVFEWLSVVGAIVLWVMNPPLRHRDSAPREARVSARTWVSPGLVAVLLAAAATTVVLGGTDVAVIAALRTQDAQSSIGWVLALWGLGSMVGGLGYGAWHRSISPFWLLLGLAAATAPVALARSIPVFAVLLLLAGLLCAPTITATVDTLSRLVPESTLGEVIGWHGSMMTTGMSIGAPMAGFAIDVVGWRAGFLVPALVGGAVAVACLLAGAQSSGRRQASARWRKASI